MCLRKAKCTLPVTHRWVLFTPSSAYWSHYRHTFYEKGSPHRGPSVSPLSSFLGHFFFPPSLTCSPQPKGLPLCPLLGKHPSSLKLQLSTSLFLPVLEAPDGGSPRASERNSTVTTVPVWTEPGGSCGGARGQEEGRCTDRLRRSRPALHSVTLWHSMEAFSLGDFERQAVQHEKMSLCVAFLRRRALMS